MIYNRRRGVPKFECFEFSTKKKQYVVIIPVINEGDRIIKELYRAKKSDISEFCDIVICDGGSTDGSLKEHKLRKLDVNALLIKRDKGKQGAQLRMGFWWAIRRGYRGIITIDGNNKDSISDIPRFVEKLEEGYDYIQGSRFVNGGRAVNTPSIRWVAIRLLHAPIISMTAHHRFTDTTNAFRAYSMRYLCDDRVQPFRDIFVSYELLAYLSVRASQLGMRVCEIPVSRIYPKGGKTPTKISFFSGNMELIIILVSNFLGKYKPLDKKGKRHFG